jgi:hypothetical protein
MTTEDILQEQQYKEEGVKMGSIIQRNFGAKLILHNGKESKQLDPPKTDYNLFIEI